VCVCVRESVCVHLYVCVFVSERVCVCICMCVKRAKESVCCQHTYIHTLSLIGPSSACVFVSEREKESVCCEHTYIHTLSLICRSSLCVFLCQGHAHNVLSRILVLVVRVCVCVRD